MCKVCQVKSKLDFVLKKNQLNELTKCKLPAKFSIMHPLIQVVEEVCFYKDLWFLHLQEFTRKVNLQKRQNQNPKFSNNFTKKKKWSEIGYEIGNVRKHQGVQQVIPFHLYKVAVMPGYIRLSAQSMG